MLFSAVLLGVGVHHLVATGTCSSTGYSANYGPVPRCPSGTGWWFAFVFVGIIGGIVGALMATSLALVFASVFGGIGFGAMSIVLDSHAHSGAKVFGGIFGGAFAIVGVGAAFTVLRSASRALSSGRGAGAPRAAVGGPAVQASSASSAFGTPSASVSATANAAFGTPSGDSDPILSAYRAAQAPTGGSPQTPPPPSRSVTAPPLTALNLVPGLQNALKQATAADPVEELTKLSELHKSGALTDEEFARAKAKLLGES